MMGGMNNWAEFTNEIWTSPDAFDWTRVTEHAPWPARRNALLLEFNQKLFLLGGSESSGKKDVLPQRSFTDAWETSDGSLWTKISDTVPPNAEQALVFQNQMWILGARGAWSSTDGKTWQEKASGRPFSNRGSFGAAVYDGKLWVFGGVDAEKTMNEVWSSNDGINWVQQVPNAPWFPRGAEYSTVFAGKLWIFGGKTGREYDQADDVWFMSR